MDSPGLTSEVEVERANDDACMMWHRGAQPNKVLRLSVRSVRTSAVARSRIASSGSECPVLPTSAIVTTSWPAMGSSRQPGNSPLQLRRLRGRGFVRRFVPDPKHISTSYVERQNLPMRMSMRRFTCLTNAFSKKLENNTATVALYFMYYNFGRVHQTLRVTPAMEAAFRITSGALTKSSDCSVSKDALTEEVDMRTYTVKKHLLIIIAFAALMVVLWVIGVLHEAPPLISN
jgi:hypothetical protein